MLRVGILALFLALTWGCSSSDVTRTLGAQCESKADCDDRCVTGADYPDGLCTVTCQTDRDCPAAARCVDKEGGICLFSCEGDPDCGFLGPGWSCKNKDRREVDEEVLVCFGE